MAADKLPVANFMTIELQAGKPATIGSSSAFRQQAGGLPCRGVEMQEIEGVKDQAHAARAIGRGLGHETKMVPDSV